MGLKNSNVWIVGAESDVADGILEVVGTIGGIILCVARIMVLLRWCKDSCCRWNSIRVLANGVREVDYKWQNSLSGLSSC
jgi:hypothetical protein